MYLIADVRCRLPRLIQVRFKQVDVGAPQQALMWNLKCAQQIGGIRLAGLWRVGLSKDDFELEERAEPLYGVKMDTRLSDEIDVAMFRDGSSRPKRRGEHALERHRVRNRKPLVMGQTYTKIVGPFVIDELCRTGGELAQLQATMGNPEE